MYIAYNHITALWMVMLLNFRVIFYVSKLNSLYMSDFYIPEFSDLIEWWLVTELSARWS